MVALSDQGAVQRFLLHQRATGARELLGCINLARISAMRQHGQLALRSLASLSENGAAQANSDKGDQASLGAALWQADPGWPCLTRICPVARGEPFASQQGTGVFSMRARGRGTCVRRMGYGPRRPSPRRKAELAALHWSVDPQDWSRPGGEAIVAAVLASVRPGAIVLLHDGCPPDRVGTLPSLWSARPDCDGARPAHSSTA
ncbi:hypothetical protein ACVWYH_005378 [Bradyrhizobium sp. GM24.11]